MPNLKTSFVSAVAKWYCRYFLSRLKYAQNIQERVLKRYIAQARDTLYGEKMRISSIKSIKDFQKNIPIQTYENFSPYIDRIKNGEKNVLFSPGEKLIMFALSSGTTATPKFIPVTGSFFKSYERGSLYWSSFMFLAHPGILDGLILPIVSSMSEEILPSGIPCGGISGLIARSQRSVARSHYFLPYPVYNIKNIDDKYYTILRFALAERNISFISSANPSTLIMLARCMDRWKEDLIADISTGGLKVKDNLPEDIVRALKPYLKSDKKRSMELEESINREGGLKPLSSWPALYLIASWRGGTVGQYLSLLKEYYGNLPVYELGLLASEGRMSIPLAHDNSQGVLDIFSNFYEFIPEEEEDNPSASVLLFNELERGKRYFITITTPYGFFRYHIHDLIEVVDFCQGVPVIAFLNKGKHISSLTGEKLTEFQVCEAMKNIGIIKGEEYTLVPCWNNHLPYYSLVAEEKYLESGEPEELCNRLDSELKILNMEYKSKRDSRRLGNIQFIPVPLNTFSRIKKDTIESRGGRIEQYKQVHLDTEKRILSYLNRDTSHF